MGKSTILGQSFPCAPLYDLEDDQDYDRISADPGFFLSEHQDMVLLDEAQLYPDLFKALRVKIDQNRQTCGQYIISGSSSPELLKNISESLAGRVAIVELSGLSWSESWGYELSDFFKMLKSNSYSQFLELKPRLSLKQIQKSTFLGAYPEPFLKKEEEDFFDLWVKNYLKTYLYRDVRRLFPKLNIEAYRRFVSMLAFASGDILNVQEFARSLDVSHPTARSYFDIAEGTFLWRNLPSYQKNTRKRVQKMPKGHLRDVGLINYILGIRSFEQLRNHPHYGKVWEIAVVEQIIKSLDALLFDAEYYYYRTHNGAEIDLIIEGPQGPIPVQIKSGQRVRPESLFSIKTFITEHNSPVGFVISQAQQALKLADRLYQIPAACL